MIPKLNPSFRRFSVASVCLLGGLCMLQACGEPATDEGQSAATEVDRRPPETKRIDLGDGLEVIEYREFRGDQVVTLNKTYKRKGATILMHTSCPSVAPDFRTYYRNGKEIFSEEIDIEGRTVTLYVTEDGGSPIEIFERQVDGTTVPISTKKLTDAKRANEFIKRVFTPIADAVDRGDKKAAEKYIDAAIEEAKAARKLDDETKMKASE